MRYLSDFPNLTPHTRLVELKSDRVWGLELFAYDRFKPAVLNDSAEYAYGDDDTLHNLTEDPDGTYTATVERPGTPSCENYTVVLTAL